LSTLSTCKQNCTTILEVLDERVFVAPGGRFRECYYWDSFWIVKGLLQSRMLETAEAVIRSFMLVVQTYGYVPNGMRVYYLGRSQPPLLALMVSELANTYRMEFQSLKAIELERDALPVLLKEHQFWMATHSREVVINGKNFTVNFYNANTSTPRPESYKEDYLLTENMTVQERSRLLKDIASAAESGWDFSTRWFADGKNLNATRTT
jgi:alpha,alpha-trehalase